MKALWRDRRLSELLTERVETPHQNDIDSGFQKIVSKIRFSDGGIEFRTRSESHTKLISIRPGDLVLSGINAIKGAVGLYEDSEPVAATIHYSSYIIKTDQVLPRFLWFYLRSDSFKEILVRQVPKGIKTELKAERLLPVIAPFPDLAEQKRILGLINEASAKVTQAENLNEQTREKRLGLWQSILADAFKDLNCDGIVMDVLSGKPKNGWSAKCDNKPDGAAVLTLSAVTGFRYNETAVKRTSLPTKKTAHYWLKKNDFLITRSNTPSFVGHVAIYNGNPAPCIYPDLIMRLPLNLARVDPCFLLYWMQTQEVRDYIQSKAKGTSPTMKKINQSTVINIPFPATVNRAQQEKLVHQVEARRSALDRFDRLLDNCEGELEALMPAISEKAFKGEL